MGMSEDHSALIFAELNKSRNRQRFIRRQEPVKEITSEAYQKILLGRDERLRLQQSVNGTPILLADINNIALTLPYCFDSQHEDVLKAEKRLWEQDKHGILFTNGTGCGKTFSAGGILNRAIKRGLNAHLIVVPSDKKCKDWIEELSYLGILVYQLTGIRDAGEKYKVVVTTYANFRENERLQRRYFDLIIYDESQNIMANQKGEETNSLIAHRQITRYKQNIDHKTKVVFLSATPFSYHTSIEYADGFILDMGENKDNGNGNPTNRQKFFIDNFGYRFERGQLIKPENEVDVDALERAFADNLLESGAMSTRSLNIPFDYSREFVLIKDNLGALIDEGYGLMVERSKFKYLFEVAATKFTHLNTIQLIECIKARASIERIKQHLALGRKVVIFHTYNNSKPEHPFHINESDYIKSPNKANIKRELGLFNQLYPKFEQLDLSGLKNVRETLKEAFGYKVAFFNGEVSKGERNLYLDRFNIDNSGKDIICVQIQAGGAGVSLHDTTGKHPRVSMNLGLPVRPTEVTQSEGRTYREGLRSNSIFEYMVLHLNFEKIAFAHIISQRVKTVENLSVGSLARSLEISFKEGYMTTTILPPNLLQGKGGKVADNAIQANISDFERSLQYYESTKKRGLISLPEPIGYSMCRLLDAKPNNKILNPMALWGNIGRFLGSTTINDYTESKLEYRSMLNINVQRHNRILNIELSDLEITNKYNGIVFYSAKDAYEQILKAYVHLRNTGRIVVALNKKNERVEGWLRNKGNGATLIAQINLPDYVIYVIDKMIDQKDGTMQFAKMAQYVEVKHVDLINSKDVFTELNQIEIQGRLKHKDE